MPKETKIQEHRNNIGEVLLRKERFFENGIHVQTKTYEKDYMQGKLFLSKDKTFTQTDSGEIVAKTTIYYDESGRPIEEKEYKVEGDTVFAETTKKIYDRQGQLESETITRYRSKDWKKWIPLYGLKTNYDKSGEWISETGFKYIGFGDNREQIKTHENIRKRNKKGKLYLYKQKTFAWSAERGLMPKLTRYYNEDEKIVTSKKYNLEKTHLIDEPLMVCHLEKYDYDTNNQQKKIKDEKYVGVAGMWTKYIERPQIKNLVIKKDVAKGAR